MGKTRSLSHNSQHNMNNGVSSMARKAPIENSIRDALQAVISRLGVAAHNAKAGASSDERVADAVIASIDSLESILFDLGYELDLGDFFDNNASPAWKPSKRTRSESEREIDPDGGLGGSLSGTPFMDIESSRDLGRSTPGLPDQMADC